MTISFKSVFIAKLSLPVIMLTWQYDLFFTSSFTERNVFRFCEADNDLPVSSFVAPAVLETFAVCIFI